MGINYLKKHLYAVFPSVEEEKPLNLPGFQGILTSISSRGKKNVNAKIVKCYKHILE